MTVSAVSLPFSISVGTALLLPVAVLVLASAASIIFHTIRCGISPMPSSQAAAHSAIELLREVFAEPAAAVEDPAAEVSGCRILDLGSGWGNLVIALARAFPECRVTGVERSPVPLAVSRLAARLVRLRAGCRRLDLQRGDFMTMPLGEADAVVCYLFPGAMERLSDRLRRELPPGTPIISAAFALPGWTPVRMVRLADLYRTPVYLFRVPSDGR